MTSVFSFPLAVVTFCVLAVLSSFQVGNAQLVYNSLGCFFDSSASRILPNSGPQNLQTLQSCGAQAVLNFVQYFGLEFGGQCFYGGSILRQVSASNCNMTCIADPKQNCGGANAISIYQVTPPPATVAYTSYLGCLTDYSSRILSQQGAQNDATVQSCAALAVARAVPYFGLEFGGECWYGSSILRNVSSSACLLACTENPNQRCGGAYAIDVYQVNPAVAVVPYSSYVGCLPAGALPSSGAQSAGTAQACAILAASKGANFFGLGNGGQCSFGSSLRTNVSGAVCNLACTASPSERCGGSLAIDVWALSLTAKQ